MGIFLVMNGPKVPCFMEYVKPYVVELLAGIPLELATICFSGNLTNVG